jgi:hypothetical protein
MKLVLVDNIEQVLETALRRKPVPLVVDPPATAGGGEKPEKAKEPEPEPRVHRRFPPVDQPPAMARPANAAPEPGLATWPVE